MLWTLLLLGGCRSEADRIADAACACPTLACVAEQHSEMTRVLAGDTAHPALRRLTLCLDTLADAFLTDVRTLTDDLCACPDRACYDALKPRVDAVFSSDNVANVGPEMLTRIQTEVQRFEACDFRFSR